MNRGLENWFLKGPVKEKDATVVPVFRIRIQNQVLEKNKSIEVENFQLVCFFFHNMKFSQFFSHFIGLFFIRRQCESPYPDHWRMESVLKLI